MSEGSCPHHLNCYSACPWPGPSPGSPELSTGDGDFHSAWRRQCPHLPQGFLLTNPPVGYDLCRQVSQFHIYIPFKHSEKSQSRRPVDSSEDEPSSQQNWLPVSAQITAASAQLSSGLWPLQTFLPNQSGILAWARVWMRL